MKVIINCRVSSKEQEESGYSLDAQEKLLKEYAQKYGFDVAKIYRISESASGKQVRKIFNEMLQYATKHKIPVILCEKIDRLTRNLKDAALISDWLNADKTREVHFVKENFIVNQNTRAHENLVWDMKVAIARFYTNNLSEEVRKGQKEKIAQGWLPQRAKIGYKSSGEKGHIIHEPDPDKKRHIIKMFELYSTGGYSLSTLTKTMKKEGLRNERGNPVSRTRIHKLLQDPYYYGKNIWMGQITDGKHEPLISKDLFDLVQEKLSIKFGGKPKYSTHSYVFKGKMHCEECGGTIAWGLQKGQLYGYCNHFKSCSQKAGVKQYQVEDQLLPLFVQIAPKNERVLKWLESVLKESHSEEIDYNTNKRESLNKVIQIADQRIEGAYRDKLDGRMPVELCEKVIKESTQEKEDAISSLSKLTEDRTAYYEAGYSIHELALRAQDIYKSPKATLEDKRLLLSYVFLNLTLNAGIVRENYTLAFEFLLKWMPKVNSTFELAEKASFKHKTEADASVCTVMRGRWDLNPRSPP